MPTKIKAVTRGKKKTHAQIFEDFSFKDKERAALWNKKDWKNVSLVYKKLREYNEFIEKLNEMLLMGDKAKDNPALYKRFLMSESDRASVTNLLSQYRKYFFALLYWWENNLERAYDDQTAYWFDTKEKFEPEQVEIISNRLTGRGLALSASYMTGQSTAYPKWIAMGTGTFPVRADNQRLTNEIARTAADYYTSNGNIISSGVLASENIQTATISEFAGMTGNTSVSSMVWQSVITDPAKRLDHEVGENKPSCSHSLYLTSR